MSNTFLAPVTLENRQKFSRRFNSTDIPQAFQIKRDQLIWELRGQFYSLAQIAEHPDVQLTPKGISSALKRLSKLHAAEFKERILEVRIQQTQQLGCIIREASSAWQSSKEDSYEQRTTEGGKDGTLQVNVTKGQTGDPRYLELVRGAMKDIREIWGIDDPVKVDLNVDADKPMILKIIHGVSMDDL